MTQAQARTLLQSSDAVGTWTLDPTRTTVRITHKTFWGLATVTGVFTEVRGGGEITTDHAITGAITVSAVSVDTKNTKRDTHLRSAAFFDVATHPHFVISVHAASAVGEHLELTGELTVKEVREPITLTATITDLDANTIAVHVTGAVDRHRFGLSFNQLGMIKGLTGLNVDAVFTRATA